MLWTYARWIGIAACVWTAACGGGARGTAPPVDAVQFGNPADLVINEADYDQAGMDDHEFVEVHNPSADPVSLASLALVLVNGMGATQYRRFDLSLAGASIPPGGYLVVGSPGVANVSLVVAPGATGWIQNGGAFPDGIALVHTETMTLIDALCYDGALPAVTIPGFAAPVSLVEGTATAAFDLATGSLSRLPDGVDSDDASQDWSFTATPTPGAPNS